MTGRRWTPQHIARALSRRTKQFAERSTVALLNRGLARKVAYMARTGEGTDTCLAEGALPLPVHFY